MTVLMIRVCNCTYTTLAACMRLGHFNALVEEIVEHPQWQGCEGCELLNNDGSTICPIRINRELLRPGWNKLTISRKANADASLGGGQPIVSTDP